MSYTVVWLPDTERRLAAIWNAVSDRQVVANAADKIDRLLRQTPLHVGESRTGDLRILLEKPLGVFYRVLPQDQIVQVGHVWRYQ